MSINQRAGRNKNNELVWILPEKPVEVTVYGAVETCLLRQKACGTPSQHTLAYILTTPAAGPLDTFSGAGVVGG